MPSLGTFLSDSRSLMMAAILAAIIVVILIYTLSRYVFGRRLHMAGGRARQPRLGVIDAYDLDRQRQLVLVRRDNVEHLIMIGGPNDLLIESAFVRAQPTVGVTPGREKDAGVLVGPTVSLSPPTLAPEPPAEDRAAIVAMAPVQTLPPGLAVEGASLAQAPRAPAPRAPTADLGRPVAPKDLGPLSDLPAPGPAAAPEPAVAAVLPSADPTKPDPASTAPVPLRPTRFPTATVRPVPTPLPPRTPLSALRATLVPTAAAPTGSPSTGANGAGANGTGSARPSLPGQAGRPAASPMQRGTSAASLRRDPPIAPLNDAAAAVPAVSGGPGPAEPEAPPPSLPAVRPPAGEAPPPMTLDSIESLEEEMARLLGRAASGEKS